MRRPTTAENRIRRASHIVVAALHGSGVRVTYGPESDDTRLEYGGGDYFTVEIDGEPYSVTLTASYLTDEEMEEERDA